MILCQSVAEISGIQVFLRNRNKTGYSLYFNVTSARKAIHRKQDMQLQSWKCIETELIRRDGKHVFSGF